MKIFNFLLFSMLLLSCGRSGDYYYNLACEEEEKGNIENAISLLDKAIEKNECDIWALNSRGFDYLELKKIDRAKADFRRIIQIDKNSEAGYYGIGMIEFKSENYIKAIENFDKVIKLKGGPAFIELEDSWKSDNNSLGVPVWRVLRQKKLAEQKLNEKKSNR